MQAKLKTEQALPSNPITQTILIVDDHSYVRSSLRAWLGSVYPAFSFIEAENGATAITLANDLKPNFVLMDINLPDISGLEAARLILADQPDLKILMLSIHDETRYREDASKIGASAFISKSSMHIELIPAINQLLSQVGIKEGCNEFV